MLLPVALLLITTTSVQFPTGDLEGSETQLHQAVLWETVLCIAVFGPDPHERLHYSLPNLQGLSSYIFVQITIQFKTAIEWVVSSTQSIEVSGGERRRWRKSKTRRSPSSPQIHQKYIYTWKCSYRTPTEHWQKTSDLPKSKKLPHVPG